MEIKQTKEERLEETVLFILYAMIEVETGLCKLATKGEIDMMSPIPIATILRNLLDVEIIKEFFLNAKSKKAQSIHEILLKVGKKLSTFMDEMQAEKDKKNGN